MKSTSARRMTRLRPTASARTDENGEIKRANKAVHEVMTDLSRDVRVLLDRDLSIETSVAEMTPVSSARCPPFSLYSSLAVGRRAYIRTAAH